MTTQIKLLDFPEFNEALLGVGDRGVALLDAPTASTLARALESALPGACLRRGSLEVEEIHALIGYFPAIDDDPWASYELSLPIWERWLHETSEDILIELFDRKYPRTNDPFMVDGCPTLDTYLQTYMANEMSALDLADALQAHPDALLSVALLKEDARDLLRRNDLDTGDRNLSTLTEDLAMLYGTGQQHQQSLLSLMAQRLAHLNLEPAWIEF